MNAQHQATAALIGLLKTGNEADRCYAARALGVFGNSSAVDALIARLRDEDIDVCVDAVEALREIGNSKAIPPLIESLENDSSGEICAAIASALGVLGGAAASKALHKVVAERPERLEMDDDWDSWWDVQLEAVRALGKLREESAVNTLITVMDSHEHQDIESEVLKALAQIGGRGVDLLIQRLRERAPKHRRRAAKALAMVNTPEATRALGQALQDDAAEVRIAAISALARPGAEKYLPAIILLMRDKSAEVRTAATLSACKLACHAAASDNLCKQLLTLLNDPSGRVRNGSFNALSNRIEKEALSAEAIETISTSLNDPSPTVGASACMLLGKNGAASVIPRLTALLADRSRDPMPRRAAAQALEQIGVITDDLVEALAVTIHDQEQSVRLAALTALVRFAAQPQSPENQEAQKSSNTPFNIVIAALTGEIQSTLPKEEPEESDRVKTIGATTKEDGEVAADCAMELDAVISKTSKSNREPEIALPATAPRVACKEQKAAISTLDAIAMDNVEATLDLEAGNEPEPLDSDATHYLGVAERQKKEAERMQVKHTFNLAADVRQLAARALADSNSEVAVTALAAIMQTEPDEALACEAISSLGKIAAHSPTTPGLMDNLGLLVAQLNMGEQERRLACARTLGQLGSRAAIAPLLTALADEIKDVRIEAIHAITGLVMDGAAPQMVLEEVSTATIAKQFLNRLEDPENGVRLAAANGLARLMELKELQGYTEQAINKMLAAALLDGAQQTRPMGEIIRATDAEMGAKKLLAQLEMARESIDRRFIIEMLEELFKPLPDQSAA